MVDYGGGEVRNIGKWNAHVQVMIDWIEEHLEEGPALRRMAAEVGYSPTYCSELFHRVTGRTLRRYVAARRLCRAALMLRDTRIRILDVALACGFSSQEALTRAFVEAYGCTPYTYRMEPRPIALISRQAVLFPGDEPIGGLSVMAQLQEANIRFEYIPAHKYIGVEEPRARNYGDFWKYHDCDEVCGIVDSMRHVTNEIVGSHMAGWTLGAGDRQYFYGFGVAADYAGPVPEGFTVREIPASLYLVFFHPPFDFLADNDEVMRRVEDLAWGYDPAQSDRWWIPGGYAWNGEVGRAYQRHFPEVLGYEVLRPVLCCREV